MRDTRLGRELVGEVVRALMEGRIPPRWNEMVVVVIPMPGRDLTMVNSWRPLNQINCVGKLGEKVVADRLQDEGSSLFHSLQYGSVRGWGATDVLYRSVTRARKCLWFFFFFLIT